MKMYHDNSKAELLYFFLINNLKCWKTCIQFPITLFNPPVRLQFVLPIGLQYIVEFSCKFKPAMHFTIVSDLYGIVFLCPNGTS